MADMVEVKEKVHVSLQRPNWVTGFGPSLEETVSGFPVIPSLDRF